MRRSILLALLLLVLPPDVAFAQRTFPGGTPTASGSGTANTLMKFDSAGNAADSSLTDDGSTVTSTVPVLLPDGTAAAPASAFADATGTGFYRSAAGVTEYVSSGSARQFAMLAGGIGLPSGNVLAWTSSATVPSSGFDTGLKRVKAAVAQVTDGSTGSGDLVTAGIITAGSGTGVTVNATGFLRRHIYSVTVTYAALAAAATTADKTIATLPAKTRLVGVVADTTTPYTGGGVTAATLIVGKTVGGNEYIVSHNVFSAAIVVGDADADLGTSINRANAIQGGDLASWTGTTAVSVRLTTTTANTDQLTAGSTTYYLTTESMP